MHCVDKPTSITPRGYDWAQSHFLGEVSRVDSGGASETRLEQIEFGTARHLPFHEFELGDLAFRLTVGPGVRERRMDSVSIESNPGREGKESACSGGDNPRTELLQRALADHCLEPVDEGSR